MKDSPHRCVAPAVVPWIFLCAWCGVEIKPPEQHAGEPGETEVESHGICEECLERVG